MAKKGEYLASESEKLHKRFYASPPQKSLEEIALLSGATLYRGQKDMPILNVNSPSQARKGDIVGCFTQKPPPDILTDCGRASACIVLPSVVDRFSSDESLALLTHNAPRIAISHIIDAFYPPSPSFSQAQETASIAESAEIGKNVTIGAYAAIAEDVEIGEGTIIGPHVSIGRGCLIGQRCHIGAHASLAYSILEDDVSVGPNTVIGRSGFAVELPADEQTAPYSISHKGLVFLKKGAKIGGNSCVDRGLFDNTIIGEYCHIGNLTQIGHNVVIEKYCVITDTTSIAGSTRLGRNCVMGGLAGIIDHINVGEYCIIYPTSKIFQDIPPHSEYAGAPESWYKLVERKQRAMKQKKTRGKK